MHEVMSITYSIHSFVHSYFIFMHIDYLYSFVCLLTLILPSIHSFIHPLIYVFTYFLTHFILFFIYSFQLEKIEPIKRSIEEAKYGIERGDCQYVIEQLNIAIEVCSTCKAAIDNYHFCNNSSIYLTNYKKLPRSKLSYAKYESNIVPFRSSFHHVYLWNRLIFISNSFQKCYCSLHCNMATLE